MSLEVVAFELEVWAGLHEARLRLTMEWDVNKARWIEGRAHVEVLGGKNSTHPKNGKSRLYGFVDLRQIGNVSYLKNKCEVIKVHLF